VFFAATVVRDEMDRTRGTSGRNKRCIQNFGCGNQRRVDMT
jgi:hypothetical protein